MTGEPMVDEPLVDEPVVDEPVVDEHCRGVPAEPLRRYVAWYTGYRQRGVPPALHRGRRRQALRDLKAGALDGAAVLIP